MNTNDIAALRREYSKESLSEHSVQSDPVGQFISWFDEAIGAQVIEPTAMTLATSSANGEPSARIVLLKGVSDRGFIFYSNYSSDKGRNLAENPRATLLFFWPELERQVRIVGSVVQIEEESSDTYFKSRPYESQIGAWTSQQSAVIETREELEQRFASMKDQYPEGNVPRPEWWGGYVVIPEQMEFWQGRPNRLHDRIRYRRLDAQWIIERLSP